MPTPTPHSQTPMMKQYFDLKERCPDSILFFRLGDFYEMFGDDARVAAKELDLTLTSRDKSTDNPHNRMPMCGVPHHSSEAYIARLIAKGYKVSICEQVEDPAEAKGLVARDIVRVVTPGTLYEPSMLDESRGNYLCAVYLGDMAAICFADMSTGEISVSEFDTPDLRKIENELSVFSPAEAIFGGDPELCQQLAEFLTAKINCLCQYCDTMFGHDDAFNLLGSVFSAERIEALIPAARRAIGGLLSYVKDTQKSDAMHLKPISRNESGAYMELDLNTIRNLELLSILSTGETKGSLLSVLDQTKTPMGRRLLRTWVLRPLLHPDPIKQRLAAVGELHAETVLRGELTRRLRYVADTERLLSRIAYKSASPRDLKLLASSIAAVCEIKEILHTVICPALRECADADDLADIAKLIDDSIMDEPPLSARDGNVFKAGVDTEVDRLRNLLDNSAEALIAIEVKERERTGKKLKVGYNKVFGYYIEIPRSSSEDVPGDYIRKQTLANAERFITQELKELEADLLSAKDKLAAIELRMYNELLDKLGTQAARIQETSRLVANLDVYCALAEAARANNYVCPNIDIGGTIDITAGRHPTVERSRTDILFVPNDALLDWETNRCILLTGPNMAGKSTYMRQ
ncbi:MAG: DNA mismatch repair protein MutS, partial [Oscillospiraceae bacterium]|nr:DNA mismatch repair protein MutS [Oscillospiraceae bacterium]